MTANDLVYADGDRIVFDGELDDEYEVTHWHPVPRLPKFDNANIRDNIIKQIKGLSK